MARNKVRPHGGERHFQKSRYDGWRRVFPHPLHGRLVEKLGWPLSFCSYFSSIDISCQYELVWRDLEAQTAYYRLEAFEMKITSAAING